MAYNSASVVRLLGSFLLLVCCNIACAETIQWRGYDIHYTTFSSTLIPQEVANAHNIIRSRNRIVTNISIRKDGQPVRAQLEGTNSNLLNQLFTMQFTEVIEETAIYYLANQIIDEKDHLRFQISVQPLDQDETLELRFTRQY